MSRMYVYEEELKKAREKYEQLVMKYNDALLDIADLRGANRKLRDLLVDIENTIRAVTQ